MLEVQDLVAAYGKIVALRGVSLEVGAGEVVSLIGPNGAGKTTLIKAITGMIPSRSGEILVAGKTTMGLKSSQTPSLNSISFARTPLTLSMLL